MRRDVMVRVGAKNPAFALATVVALVLFKKSKLIKFDPKLKTLRFSTLVNSAVGRMRTRSPNLKSRLTFKFS